MTSTLNNLRAQAIVVLSGGVRLNQSEYAANTPVRWLETKSNNTAENTALGEYVGMAWYPRLSN